LGRSLPQMAPPMTPCDRQASKRPDPHRCGVPTRRIRNESTPKSWERHPRDLRPFDACPPCGTVEPPHDLWRPRGPDPDHLHAGLPGPLLDPVRPWLYLTASATASFYDVLRVVQSLIAADKANIELNFNRAAAIDLAGRNVLEAVQMSVNPKVITTPKVAAVAKDGIQLVALSRVTVRADIEGLELHVLGTVVDNATGDSVLYLPSVHDDDRIWLVGVANLEGCGYVRLQEEAREKGT